MFNVFWGHLMIGIALIHLATLLSENALQITRPVLLPLSFLWISWAVVGVWRCASNVTKKYWGQLARFLSLIFSVSPFWLLP